MICFRDMSFCSSKCANMKCHRQYTKEAARSADIWWNGPLGTSKERTGAPVAFMDFRATCADYQPEDKS